ncbi:peptidylprolyl isomerase [Virgibacillus halodenitrificans]|uniref:Peptidyl-prolyl cis-trans isomerase n=1 Tax=Virgibacillus halodenitrificans TaxID=1482 RepID=A0AAC9J0H4_VIRHA|nr:peptidylprolyl isomerase [Virgibacillus halodenitrificans]APC48857.1 peptidylprolyl isomerase [Virgibacillus halodenitrificans]MBD1224338.1 peptidylprolyl isomerase [Virgibacillus halodenitrificans]MCG1029375.1 peptidylprolyl isomerase [Virgibacillus halodenitrificans]MEC2158497.1 peptidylprolyl isomerase [Virgibacillus halodenitrificans]
MRLFTKLFIVVILFTIILSGCGTQEDSSKENEQKADQKTDYPHDVKENPIVTITMENDETIKAELYPEKAPTTVANFISLIQDGFYDGLIFHRVIPEFMIQGGDPEGIGTGGPGYSIDGEFNSNGFDNNLKHERGTLSMARSQDPDSAGSQFFIMVNESPHLDGDYAAFGKVNEGMETVDKIVNTERNEADKPLNEQKMKKVEVDTKGYNYPQPKKN